ncbi:MAG: nuclear transport factor 2 family protein [Nitrososphaeraceae archaeon]|jgi:ketosteroid isomerase-like protein
MRLTEPQINTLIVSGMLIQHMSGKMTPEEVLNSVIDGINAGDLDSLMTLYEPLACFASQPGQLAKSPDGIRESLRGFIDMNGKLDLKVKRVLKASDLALVTSEWSFSGTGSDGKHVDITSKSADVLRQQPDGTWRFVIDNPWGTD